MNDLRRKLYLCLVAVNMLEGLQFYSSFACAFSFAERPKPAMEGNSNVIRLIARDENLHLQGTRELLRRCRDGREDDMMALTAKEMEPEACRIVDDVLEQERLWIRHLFDGGSMELVNERNLDAYVRWLAAVRREEMELPAGEVEAPSANPLPWMDKWLEAASLAQAPQEVTKSAYVVDSVDPKLDRAGLAEALGGLE